MLRPYRPIFKLRGTLAPRPPKPVASTFTRSIVSFTPQDAVGKQEIRLRAFQNDFPRSSLSENRFRPGPISIFIASGIRGAARLTRDRKQEEELRRQPYSKGPDPNVSTTSSVAPILGGRPVNTPKRGDDDVDMLKGIKNDLQTVKETFALRDVPREPLYFGLIGVLPYVATSFTTIYLAWDINYFHIHGMPYLVSEETATHLLHFLESLQIGYGAVILSFLGAIHWGLEFAEYGGKYNRRHPVGLVSCALAWSTTLLPLHSALLTQFAGFTGMYFFDSTASTSGYAPPWYSTYRFVLTFIVGAAVVITLIGRGQLGDFSSHGPAPVQRLKELRDEQRYNEEKEREAILRAKQLDERRRIEEEERRGLGSDDPPKSEGSDAEESQTGNRSNSGGDEQSSQEHESSIKDNDSTSRSGNAGKWDQGDQDKLREEMRGKQTRPDTLAKGPEPSPEKANVKPQPE